MAASVGTRQAGNLSKIALMRGFAGFCSLISAARTIAEKAPALLSSKVCNVKNLAHPALLAIPLIFLGPIAHAQWESHQNIRNTAISYLESLPPVHPLQTRSDIQAGKLDTRLKLAKCSAPLKAGVAGKQTMGRMSVEIRCSGEKPWKTRLPVNVSVYVPVAITSNPVPRNKQILKSDIFFEERNISTLFNGFYTKNDEISGLVARMQIKANTPLTPSLVQPQKIVKRGQVIDLYIKTKGYEIHSEGKALTDGARGDVIRVRNTRSQKIIEGTVVGPGLVQVGHHSSH